MTIKHVTNYMDASGVFMDDAWLLEEPNGWVACVCSTEQEAKEIVKCIEAN